MDQPCDQPPIESPAAEIAAAVAEWRAGGQSVVAVVPSSDRAAIRKVLPADVSVVPLSDPSMSLEQAAARVLAVPDRCVVIAERRGAAWGWVATAGSAPADLGPTPPPEPVPYVPSRHLPAQAPPRPRAPVDLASPLGLWVGVALRSGYPTLASGMGTLHLGPVWAEAGTTELLGPWWRDRWWRVGALLPARVGEGALWLGGSAGRRYRRIGGFDEQRGDTVAAEGEWAAPTPGGARGAWFVHGTVGVDLVETAFAHLPGSHVTPHPVAEIGFGVRVALWAPRR